MTPEPKYFTTKNAHSGTPIPLCRKAYTGKDAPVSTVNHAHTNGSWPAVLPHNDPINITKSAEIRSPILPSKSFLSEHGLVSATTVAVEAAVSKAAEVVRSARSTRSAMLAHHVFRETPRERIGKRSEGGFHGGRGLGGKSKMLIIF